MHLEEILIMFKGKKLYSNNISILHDYKKVIQEK